MSPIGGDTSVSSDPDGIKINTSSQLCWGEWNLDLGEGLEKLLLSRKGVLSASCGKRHPPMVNLNEFKPMKPYLVCVDSDGCAMDTMDIKHFRCFGPCMVTEWGLEEWSETILTYWNDVNLYTMTRGINRFKGLAIVLAWVNEKFTPIAGIEALSDWAENANELSNGALAGMIEAGADPVFTKALNWSKAVNASITALPDSEKKPFPFAKEGLEAAHVFADVAVVSSANKEAVVEEWERCQLLDSVDVLCCQDAGSKAHCIAVLKAMGYEADHILMVGDAPGDKAAAEKNGVYYYPILVKHEGESWTELINTGLAKLQNGEYAAYEVEKKAQFLKNLGQDE